MSPRDRRTPTPQLALRVAAFGLIAFGVFAILFLRLWFLQVLQGDQYLKQASENRSRVVRVAASRGTIVDRNRNTLVENKVTTVVTLQADAVPSVDRDRIAEWGQKQGEYDVSVVRLSDQLVAEQQRKVTARRAGETKRQKARREKRAKDATAAERRATVRAMVRRRNTADREARSRLSGTEPRSLSFEKDASPLLRRQLETIAPVLKISPATLYDRVVLSTVKLPWAGVPLKSKNVSAGTRNFLLEQRARFPGIAVTREYVREYPGGNLASQIFGTVGQISKSQLREARYQGLQQGQVIGQDGLERAYDSYLRGKDGQQRVEVNAQNRPTGAVEEVKAKQGSQLRLTLDEGLEKTGQFAMQTEIGNSIDDKTGYRAAGAYVALDPRNGEVLAMGSYPSVDLNTLNGNISSKKYKRLLGKRAGSPMVNRAIAGQYPTGSTFKPVTALAGLSAGVITPDEPTAGGACRTFGTAKQEFCNAGKADLGGSDLERALQVSSDVYFYDIGANLYNKPDKPLQTWARLFGYGKPTGIDLSGEASGIVPDSAWRAQRDKDELACRKQKGVASCGLVSEIGGQFLLGDNVNLSVGQGDFLATPLQVATAYSGLYDKPGVVTDELRFPTPHLAQQVESLTGELQSTFESKPARVVKTDAGWKKKILDGLHEVTSTPEGTAAGVFAGWDQTSFPVYGKTGTAQRCNDSACTDQAWFAGMVRDPQRPIVVVATVEAGGFGTTTAAPVVCRMLRKWYDQPAAQAPCASAKSTTGVE